jgi:hypothetical protein
MNDLLEPRTPKDMAMLREFNHCSKQKEGFQRRQQAKIEARETRNTCGCGDNCNCSSNASNCGCKNTLENYNCGWARITDNPNIPISNVKYVPLS